MPKYRASLLLLFIYGYGVFTQKLYSSFLTSHANPCDLCKTHIACNTTLTFDQKCYTNVDILVMTQELRDLILDKHNYYRNLLASGTVAGFRPAMRMASLYWNIEFEFLSALNLLQCHMAHDKCRRTPIYPYVGQNLAYLKWRGYDFTMEEVLERLIGYWFEEHENSTMSDILEFPPRPEGLPLIGHFTLMVQERADQVGCSILRQISDDNITEVYFACDYSFTNIYTVPVYRTGRPASGCTSGVNPKYTNLCALYEKYDTSTHRYASPTDTDTTQSNTLH